MIIAAAIAGPIVAVVARRSDFRMSGSAWDVARYAATIVAAVALPFRRRRPVATLAVVAPLAVVALALQVDPALAFLVGLSLYSVTTVAPRRTSQVSVGVVAMAVLLALVAAGGSRMAGSLVSAGAIALAAWLAGENSRGRRIYAAAVAERAAERELEREERLRRAVADERVIIARELHDVVAHAMSVIAVRSGVARVVLESRPDEAREALGIIETTTRRALQEMRLLVGVLRRVDGSDTDLQPAPGLSGLDDLVHQIGHAGVKVRVDIDGDPRPLPPGVDLSAYRIIQEALTNAVRHAGPTRAELRIAYQADEITIEVIDEGSVRFDHPRPDPGGSGHGLIGMRERAALYGGELTAGPHGHGFRVHARLSTSGRLS